MARFDRRKRECGKREARQVGARASALTHDEISADQRQFSKLV
jgi:hypothetical protein